MVDVISVVLAAIQEIVQIVDEIEEVGTQAARLARRLATLEGPVKRVKKYAEEGKYIYPERKVRRLEDLVRQVHAFLRELKVRNLFRNVVNRRSDLERFHTLTEDLKEVVVMFNFELNFQAWDQENERDRENDGKRLLHIEKMLEDQAARGFEHAEEPIIVEQKAMYEELMSYNSQSTTGADGRQSITVRAIYLNFYLRKNNVPFRGTMVLQVLSQ